MRRRTGALACLLTLHLTLVAGDLGCGRHPAGASEDTPVADAPAQPDEAAPHAAHHTQGAPATEPDQDEPTASCRTPSRADCCEAMASCQIQIAFAEAAQPVATSDGGATVRAAELPPASSALAPDLPPRRPSSSPPTFAPRVGLARRA
jgi:hypothetical protein